ncbi:DNA replication licensing factor MCM4 [Acrasis kona]|uniref:DNA replication licensing factor MCM4 n=1 Tax=Acrasis kona TaxID=1008807 RepID=A0AAW2YQ82_9EUKA
MEKVKNFLTCFETNLPGEEPRKKYLDAILDLHVSNSCSLTIDCLDLPDELYFDLVAYPQEIISLIDVEVNHVFNNTIESSQLKGHKRISVKLFNLRQPEIKAMRDLDPINIDQLVTIRGMVTRLSEVIPDLLQAFFRCSECNFIKTVILERGHIEEPTRCEHCAEPYSMELIHQRCTFTDKQLVKLQETPESIPEGETPHTVNLCVFEELVDSVKPGDRVEVTGIYKAVPIKVDGKKRTIKTVYKNFIDVLHFSKTGIRVETDSTRDNPSDQLQEEEEEEQQEESANHDDEFDQDLQERRIVSQLVTLTQGDVQSIRDLSKDEEIYEHLTQAIAPSIYKMDDVKKGVLLQLFGGTNKTLPNNRIRGEIHVLLVGDPGVSKSQILSHIHKIAPRGIYTSGKGSSAVGLTAYVTKDQDTGEFVLESGALVLSDLGVCCIDEFDKMNDSTRSILHEVMEQQTVSVAKAGIICSLNARTSVLAAANPKESRYNDFLSIVDNIQLPPTLLSRFDLIFLLRDIPDQRRDMELARHIVGMHLEVPLVKDNPIDTNMLTKYISYAKNKIHPVITNEAGRALVSSYLELRRMGSHRKQITATTRQLESLVRLSEGHARMRLSETVEVDDVKEALRLVRVSIFQAAKDPKSGQVDIDLLTTGMNKEQREEAQNETDEYEQDVDW